ncbi:Sucrose phosphate phosphatase [Rhynchospora pubera]|uniref:Sucrose-phosphatase n=1 Tax=Rhynchospora pubera TaxID=906938 RepID=A0AAV8HSR8_9POAL|nr:Sucrose phosphate phosphatase [Rhynchospora pubera]
MDRLDGSANLMLVSDLDDTMVDHTDPDNLSLLRFNALWESTYRQDSILVFSTGRSPILYKKLRKEKPILTPDITITSVGTEIAYGEELVPDEGWVQLLSQNWNRNVVLEETARFPDLIPQADMDQGPHKVSFYIPKEKAQEVISPLYTSLTQRGLDVKIIYSSGLALDVLPKGAGKGQALAYLIRKFGLIGKPPKSTIVCGDSGNDSEMFTIKGVYGVMVHNSREELLEWYEENAKSNHKIIHATERCASGIIEAIGRFQLGPSISPRDAKLFFSSEDNRNPASFMVNFYLLYESWLRAEVEKSEAIIHNLKSITHSTGVIVHPSGVEKSIHQSIDALESCHGDKRGTSFRVWLDKILFSAIGLGSWLLKFNKWELNGTSSKRSVTTVLLNSKMETPYVFCIMHIHQTWLEEYSITDQQSWIF